MRTAMMAMMAMTDETSNSNLARNDIVTSVANGSANMHAAGENSMSAAET
jgi:hypothetical protein